MHQRTEDQLARLRVAVVTEHVPRSLVLWILERLQSPAAKRAHRQREINRAAVAIGASRKGAARKIAEIVSTFEQYPGLLVAAWYPEDSPERIIQLLMRAGHVPRSPRQLLRLIA